MASTFKLLTRHIWYILPVFFALCSLSTIQPYNFIARKAKKTISLHAVAGMSIISHSQPAGFDAEHDLYRTFQ